MIIAFDQGLVGVCLYSLIEAVPVLATSKLPVWGEIAVPLGESRPPWLAGTDGAYAVPSVLSKSPTLSLLRLLNIQAWSG